MRMLTMTQGFLIKLLLTIAALFGILPIQARKTSADIKLIDLGLSVKWANMNIDAEDISEKGGYYAWGETNTKDTYTWETYTLCSGSVSTCVDLGSDISMDFNYDRAYHFSSQLSLPTAAQWNELINQCTWTETTVEGVKGYNVQGPNGKSIFLPFSGCSYEGNNYGVGSYAYYWSANNVSKDVSKAQAAYIKSGTTPIVTNINRRTGMAIRAVGTPVNIELIDLGLSVKWANMNIDATDMAERGGYYAWGETRTKETYTWETYNYCSSSASTCQNIGSNISKVREYDRAYEYSTKLCLPTTAQWKELISQCTWTEVTVGGVKGYNVQGPNGKSIFLPFSGCSYDGNDYGVGSRAYYWSANNVTFDVSKAQAAYIKSGEMTTITNINRRTGNSIRAVGIPESDQPKIVRIFLNDGNRWDFLSSEIDSITANPTTQKVWKDGSFTSFDIETIDSIWYMSPTLRLTTTSLNFGKVAVGNAKTIHANMTNSGDYPERYMMLTGGGFSVKNAAQETLILPGESMNVELTFTPTDSIDYSSILSIVSESIDRGMMTVSLFGEGVASELAEEDIDASPVEATFDILLEEDESIEDFNGFKIINFNGEYSIDVPAMAKGMRKVKRVNKSYNMCTANANVSSQGLQLHSFTDPLGNPYMFTITLPNEKPEISFTQTAITLLITHPYLTPADEADYQNTVALLKQLNSFSNFVNDVRNEYNNARKNNRAPDYSKVNFLPIFNELYNMVKDNTILTLSGVSLKDVKVTPQSAMLKLHNDYKRTLAVYASRVKMNESNLLVTDQEEITMTYAELISKMIDYLYKLIDKEVKEESKYFREEDMPLLAAIEEMVKELAALGKNDPDYQQELPIWVPYIMESGKSSYWDIVWDARWLNYYKELFASGFDFSSNSYKQNYDESIFAKESEELSYDFKGFDRIQLDIYGLGTFGDKSWDDFTSTDKARMFFMLAYGGYFDVVQPMVKIITGNKKLHKVSASKNYNYDLRYASKWPELGLVTKLYLEFRKDPKNWRTAYEKAKKGDLVGILKQLGKFAWGEMKKIPSELEQPYTDENKCTYVNLIYHIGKNLFGIPQTSAEFREKFKSCANTFLKLVNIASATIEISEGVMDFVGGEHAIKNSEVKETFMINRFNQPYVHVIEPTETFLTPNVTVHFQWEGHRGNSYGEYAWTYDLEVLTESPSAVKQTVMLSEISETSCDLDLATIPNANSASKISFRIIAHQPGKPSLYYAMTDFIPLVHNLNVSQKQPPEMIDLGLPSGTKWAFCNLGAKTNLDFGDYYAWGETDTKNSFSWKSYKYSGNTANSLTKYCTKSSYGRVDDKITLEQVDDRVKTDYGYYFSIPTKEDWQELIDNCKWTRYDNHFMVRGPNGNIIILPSCGYRDGLNIYDNGVEGYYWSSAVDEKSPDDAWFVHIKNAKPEFYSYYRYQGRCIRPVEHKPNYASPGTAQ